MTNKPLPLLFPYYGGKFRMRDWIIENMPKHDHYVEPFGGSAAVLLGKPPSKIETYNDLNYYIVNLFRQLKDDEAVEKIQKWLSLTPYSRAEYNRYREEIKTMSGWEQAAAWIYLSNSAIGGRIVSGSHFWKTYKPRQGVGNKPRQLISKTKLIPRIAKRLKLVQIECRDACDVIGIYDTPETLFYCDPPYTDHDNDYIHKVDQDEMLSALLEIDGMAMLSGYPNEKYNILLEHGWQLITKQASMSAARSKTANKKRTECLWINPKAWSRRPQKDLF